MSESITQQVHCAGCRGADATRDGRGVDATGHCVDCRRTDYLGRDCRGRDRTPTSDPVPTPHAELDTARPRPWHWTHDVDSIDEEHGWCVVDGDGETVAPELRQADAILIVKAVNALEVGQLGQWVERPRRDGREGFVLEWQPEPPA